MGPEKIVEAKDPSPSPGYANMLELDPIFAASCPARPTTSPPPPPAVLERLLPSGHTGFDPRVRIQNVCKNEGTTDETEITLIVSI